MPQKTDKTQAIVLTTIPINDRSQFVHLYAQQFGRITCRVPVLARGRKASQLRNMMSPMTLLDLVLTSHPGDAIHGIGEAVVLQSPYLYTYSNPGKGAQCQYMAELIEHTVREEEANPRLWDYLTAAMDILQHSDEGWANFHLLFTTGLCRHLGFSVDTDSFTPGCQFDLVEGVFTTEPIYHSYYFNPTSAQWFCYLFKISFADMPRLTLSRQQRATLLDMLLAFLAQHIPEMGHLRSIEVLKTLFD